MADDSDSEFFELGGEADHAHGLLAQDGKLRPGCLRRVAQGRPLPEGVGLTAS